MIDRSSEVREALKRFTYKINTKVKVKADLEKGWYTFELWLPSRHDSVTRRVSPPWRRWVRLYENVWSYDVFHRNGKVNMRRLQYILTGLIRTLEWHEMDEWFRLDGKPLTEPHA